MTNQNAGDNCPEFHDYDASSIHFDTFRNIAGIEIILGVLSKFTRGDSLSKVNLLDAGCGSGNYLKALSPMIGSAVGIDINEAMLAKAKEKLSQQSNVTLKAANLLEVLPFDNGQFNAAFSSLVIHHLNPSKLADQTGALESDCDFSNLDTYLNEIFRVLEPGVNAPLIICTITRKQFCESFWYNYFACKIGLEDLVMSHGVRFPPKHILLDKLQKAGFSLGPQMVPTSEHFTSLDHYLNVNLIFDQKWRSAHSTFTDYENYGKLPQLLDSIKQAQESGEINKYIEEAENNRLTQGTLTFYTAYKP